MPTKTSKRAVKAKVIAMLIQGMSIKDAAAECGVPKNTVYEWKELDPEFQEMLVETEDRVIEAFLEEGTRRAQNQIADLGMRAAEVLRESLYHTDPHVRLQAAGVVLRVIERQRPQQMGFERSLSQTDDDPAHGD